MTITAKISSFLDDQRKLIRDFYRLDYWDSHTLIEGLAEAAEEATWFVHEKTKESHRFVQASAGAGLGVAKLLGALPIGLLDWGMQVVDEVPKGPGQTIYKLFEVPIKGFYHGGLYVFETAKQWGAGSLNNQDSYAIANEVTATLGTAALLLFGVKKGLDGGSKFLSGVKAAATDLAFTLSSNGEAVATAMAGVAEAALTGGSDLLGGVVMMSAGQVQGSTKKDDGAAKADGPSSRKKQPLEVSHPTEEMISFGKEIRSLREKTGKSRTELEKICRMPPQTLNRIENGRAIGRKYWKVLENSLGVSPNHIYDFFEKLGLETEHGKRGFPIRVPNRLPPGRHAKLGAEVARVRLERHLTQAKLSFRTGIDRSELSAIERGHQPGWSHHRDLERVLGLEEGYFARFVSGKPDRRGQRGKFVSRGPRPLSDRRSPRGRYARVGEEIVRLRVANGLTQQALADQINITASALSRVENGHRRPLKIYPKLEKAFGLEAGYFTKFEEESAAVNRT